MNLPRRKYPRAKWHSYSGATYFVTICTAEKKHYLGEIISGEMTLSRLGEILNNNIAEAPSHHSGIEISHWVVMPNHFHALIIVNGVTPSIVGSQPTISEQIGRSFTMKGAQRELLGVVVGGIKAAVTRYARKNDIEFAWQRGFHDRIVRTWEECNRISDYIKHNPDRWDADCMNPVSE